VDGWMDGRYDSVVVDEEPQLWINNIWFHHGDPFHE
jgi:hypothetical protein